MPAINNDFCFRATGWSIQTTRDALNYYTSHKKDYSEWLYNNQTTIFLDTNVLINLYSISRSQREQLLKFLTKNKDRIYLTHQVSKEYLKHRLSKAKGIREAYSSLTSQYEQILDTTIKNIKGALKHLNDFASKSIILDDLPESNEKLQSIREKINNAIGFTSEIEAEIMQLSHELSDQLRTEAAEIIKGLQYEYTDPILDVISQLNILDVLTDEEQTCLTSTYDSLLDNFNKVKTDIDKKNAATFPGCGDRKKLADGEPPYGDFFIYHEMMKYVSEHNEDILFITRDITKSDWLKTDKRPFVHYLVDTFAHTGHMIYIIPANDFFPVSFASLSLDPPQPQPPTEGEIADTAPESTLDSDESPTDEPNSTTLKEEPVTISRPKLDVSKINLKSLQDYVFNSLFATDKYDLDDNNFDIDDADITNNRTYRLPLRDITREQFIRELGIALKWAAEFGDKYLSEYLFIYDILKNKHFRNASSKKMLESLIADGIVSRQTEEHNGKNVSCLSLRK